MRTTPFLLADVEVQDVLATWQAMNPSRLSAFIVVAAIGLVTLLAFAWATFVRKRRRRHRLYHHTHHHSATPANPQETSNSEDSPVSSPTRRRRRRSLRKHRVRNPTLAETGGLPPVRPEGESPPDLPA